MATRLSLSGQVAEGNDLTYTVTEDFDTVMNQVFPAQPPGSGLEYQQNSVYTSADTGQRLLIPANLICVVEELTDD